MTETTEKDTPFEKNPSNILPAKYTLDSMLKFRCHPGISCFTQCCGTINIVLTPFDILRLRKRLNNMGAADFIHNFTNPIYLEKTDLPGVIIKLTEEGRCPFVTPEGCIIYTDRPTACRYYPVGMANFHEAAKENETAEEFYFIVKESHCRGFEEDKMWTIREWREDQGVDVCDRMNKGWMEIIMRRKSFGLQATLSEPAKKIFFMASTDLDSFRTFVFESSFLNTYIIDEDTIESLKIDDVALMHFSFRFLASSLFGTQDLKITEEKIQAKVEEMKKKQQEKSKEAEKVYEELVADREKLKQMIDKNKKG